MFSVCWKFGVHLACPRVFFSFCALLGDFLRDFLSSDLSGIWNKFLWGNWCSNISKHTYGDSLANHSLKSPEFEVSPNHSFFFTKGIMPHFIESIVSMLKVKVQGMVGLSWLIERSLFIYKTKGGRRDMPLRYGLFEMAPSWVGPFVDCPFHDR